MEQHGTFNPSFFQELKKAEKNYFWFKVRRKWISDIIRRFENSAANVLEIGCGTGNVSSFLAQKGYHVTGCEFYKEAINEAWPGYDRVQGDAATLPFADDSFDIVGLFDVLEHFSDETQILTEARRVLNKTGILVITVPARNELWSGTDEIAFHKRRYSISDLNSSLTAASFLPVSIEYIFMMLYLPMKLLRGKKAEAVDHFKISKALNLLMMLYFECERCMSRVVKLPIGTSIIAVAKKS
jgi:SAM-dependent methyltransferase